MTHDDLSRPVDASFAFVGGRLTSRDDHEGRHLAIREDHMVVIDDAREGDANQRAWDLPGGRNAVAYRALDLQEVHEVSLSDAESAAASPNAVWYVWRVYYGHGLDAVLSADQGTFSPEAKTGAENATGGIQDFASTNGLSLKMVVRGLAPVGDATFARSPEELAHAYHSDGPPAPVFVEYRRLPRAQTARRTVDWTLRAPPPPVQHPGFISGNVVDKKTRAPLGSVTVTVTSDALKAPRSVVTDVSGNYSIVGLNPGAYQIHFLYRDDAVEARADGAVAVAQGQFTTVNVKLER
jgi:hypothetical protein